LKNIQKAIQDIAETDNRLFLTSIAIAENPNCPRNFMYKWMENGKYRVIGTGKNYIPRIHVEDRA